MYLVSGLQEVVPRSPISRPPTSIFDSSFSIPKTTLIHLVPSPFIVYISNDVSRLKYKRLLYFDHSQSRGMAIKYLSLAALVEAPKFGQPSILIIHRRSGIQQCELLWRAA